MPAYWLDYTPQFSKDLTDDTKQVVNYISTVCQSNVTMCEGVDDPYDLSNIKDLDDALAAATAIGGAVIAVVVILPLMCCLCVGIFCCKKNKMLCFKEQEVDAAPQQAQKAAPTMVGQGGVPPPMHHPGMMGAPMMGGMPMAGGVTHH